MSSLDTIHSIAAGRADVDAGVLWKNLTTQAFAHGVTPAVLTGFLGLSIGGTLSVGGVSAGNERGAQDELVRHGDDVCPQRLLYEIGAHWSLHGKPQVARTRVLAPHASGARLNCGSKRAWGGGGFRHGA
jgi:FAD/FMN-containing dehydrogenase